MKGLQSMASTIRSNQVRYLQLHCSPCHLTSFSKKTSWISFVYVFCVCVFFNNCQFSFVKQGTFFVSTTFFLSIGNKHCNLERSESIFSLNEDYHTCHERPYLIWRWEILIKEIKRQSYVISQHKRNKSPDTIIIDDSCFFLILKRKSSWKNPAHF